VIGHYLRLEAEAVGRAADLGVPALFMLPLLADGAGLMALLAPSRSAPAACSLHSLQLTPQTRTQAWSAGRHAWMPPDASRLLC
jgi:hypothetical protein